MAMHHWLKLLISAACGLALFLVLDFGISHFIKGTPLDRYAEQLANSAPLTVSDPIFDHTLRPNLDGTAQWGAAVYRLRTNSLGFLDAVPRHVEQLPTKRRI